MKRWRPVAALRDEMARRHGTWRGCVRAALALLELRIGRLKPFRLQQPQQVRRVVFVCLGNICRSAYALAVAKRLGMTAASVGLSTSTGAPSPDQAIQAALRAGDDMSTHRATNIGDFEVLAGDLLLVMEVRQAHALRYRFGGRGDVEVALLGLWCDPPMPHLHDPFSLDDVYFDRCFARVSQAVHALHRALPQLSKRSAG